MCARWVLISCSRRGFFLGGGGGSSLTRVHLCIQTRRTSIFLINSWPITRTISPKTNFLSNVLWVSMAPLHQRSRKLWSKLKKKNCHTLACKCWELRFAIKWATVSGQSAYSSLSVHPGGWQRPLFFFFWKVSFSQKKKPISDGFYQKIDHFFRKIVCELACQNTAKPAIYQ